MLHFIPGWYANGQWQEQEQYWHARRMHTEFDDTVKHVQLFHRNQIYPFQMLILSYAPNFRHFLHRQGVYHGKYWSCFDAIQKITRRKAALLSFHNLKWPAGTEFLYSMFAVIAVVNGEKYAKIEFGEDGNPIEVHMYKQGQVIRKNIYDDRGFVSSTVIFQDGNPLYQDYLGEDGVWRIRCYMSDNRAEINPRDPTFFLEGEEIPFKQSTYGSMEQLIEEVLTAYVSRRDRADIYCAAAHPLHLELIKRVLSGKKLILSFFEDRYPFSETEMGDSLFYGVQQVISDSKGTMELMKRMSRKTPPCTVIPPFDSRPDFGISLQLNTQKILVPVDGLEEAQFQWLITRLYVYLQKNANAQIHLFTRQAEYGIDQQILQMVKKWIGDIQSEAGKTLVVDDQKEKASAQEIVRRFFADQCVDELTLSKCLREQRLIVDFRNVRDVYLRIIAISMGIPQIMLYPSEFMISGENGLLLRNPEQLNGAIHYYLGELKNWNKAMVAAYELGKKYDTKHQVENWKGVMDSFEEHSNPAFG